MRALLSLLLALAIAPAYAEDTPYISGGSSVPSTTATTYGYAMANFNLASGWSTTEALAQNIIGHSGTGKNLYVEVGTAPGVGKSWTITLVKNGIDTSVGCPIVDTATSCNDVIDSFSLTEGDTVSVKSVPSGTPTAPVTFRFGWVNSGSVAGESSISGSTRGSGMSTSATEYHGVQECAVGNATLANKTQIMPTGGTIDRLRVQLNDGAPGGSASYTFTLLKNGSTVLMTCPITGAATSCTDLLSSPISFAAGDTIALQDVPSSTPVSRIASWTMRWLPTIPGESLILHSSNETALNTAGNLRFLGPSGTTAAWGSGEAAVTSLIPGTFIFRKWFLGVNADPSPGNYNFKNRINAVNGAFSVTINSGTTTNNDTSSSDTLAAGDELAISAMSASSPTATFARWGFVLFDSASPTATPTPTATNTPTSTPTNTPIPPTATPTNTPVGPTPTPGGIVPAMLSVGVGQ